MNDAINKSSVLNWFTIGRTILILKNKGNVPSKFRPITSLPLMRKLLTRILAEEIYDHLDKRDLLPQEQTCFSRGVLNHLLLLDDLKLYGKNRKELDTLVNTVRYWCGGVRSKQVWDFCAEEV